MTIIINGTTGITNVNGTAAAPAETGTDTDSGIVYGTNTVSLATNGTTAVTVDASQNVGIGATSIVSPLQIGTAAGSSPAGLTGLTFRQASGSPTAGYGYSVRWDNSQNTASDVGSVAYGFGGGSGASSGYMRFSTADTERMRIDASGNVGIGTTTMNGRFNSTPKATYNPGGTTWAESALNTAGSYGGGLSMIDGTAGYGLNVESSGGAFVIRQGTVGSSPTERMRIDSSGNLLVNTTSAPSGTQTGYAIGATTGISGSNSGNFSLGLYRLGNDGQVAQFYRAATNVGSISVTASATAYNTSSDYRLKDITGSLTGAKDFIMALQPKQGTWKADGSKFVGFLAHEFQEVSPSSVVGDKDAVDADGNPIMQAMQASSSEVMANLVSFIQEQQAIITELTARITALENK